MRGLPLENSEPSLLCSSVSCLLMLVALLAAYRILWVQREPYIENKLNQSGVTTEAQAINKRTVPGRVGIYYMLKYQFEAAGQAYENDLPISKASYDKYEVGQPITVRYTPNNPKVSRPVL